jgi:hypothetical protein
MKIVMTKKKKEELIAEILKHTDYQNGKVIIKSHTIESNVEIKPKVVKPKKEVMKTEPKKELKEKIRIIKPPSKIKRREKKEKNEPSFENYTEQQKEEYYKKINELENKLFPKEPKKKKEVIKEEYKPRRYVSDNTGYNVDGSIQEWKIEEIKKTNEVLQDLGGPYFWKNPYKILDSILGKRHEVQQILVDEKTKSFKYVVIEYEDDGIIKLEYGKKTPNGFGKNHDVINRVTGEEQKVFVPPLHSYLIYSNGKVSGGVL